MQLAATGNSNNSDNGFPKIRWAQLNSKLYGSVPNERLQNVFMAVTMDLGHPDSPLGSIHPWDKQDVGARLVVSARAVVYKDDTSYYQGPSADIAIILLRYNNISNLFNLSLILVHFHITSVRKRAWSKSILATNFILRIHWNSATSMDLSWAVEMALLELPSG